MPFGQRHPGCRFAYTPKSRVAFWRRKFEQNVARDQVVNRALLRLGWRVLRVWECELGRRHEVRVVRRLQRALG